MDSDYDSVRLPQYVRLCNCATPDCNCEGNNVYEWAWDKGHSTHTAALSDHNLEVKFHSGYSNGTAAVRGNKLLEKGRHHYWEIKMLTPVYGTDVMVGVGTIKTDLYSAMGTFCSLLGLDQESFGFSYHGYIQHGGEKRNYGTCFGQGNLVGVHLDTWKGTLEFFLNRKSLGIAFTGLRDLILYPMVSSTAAQSKMRLLHSCSVPVSLQIECLEILQPMQRAYLSNTFPGLRYLFQSIFADILHKNLDKTDEERDDLEFPAECMILDEFDFALVGLGIKKRKKHVNTKHSHCLQHRHEPL